VWIDRAIDWQSTVTVRFNVTIGAGAEARPALNTNNVPVVVFGRDAALAPFPLHSLVNTMTATINDTQVTVNTDNILYEVLRLCDYKKHRLSRTCPTMLDKFAFYAQAANGINTPLADYLSQSEYAEQPNGAFWDIAFANPNNGVLLAGGTNAAPGTYQYPVAGAPVTVNVVNGVPCRRITAGPAEPSTTYPVAIKFTSTEKLVLSPFIFANAAEWESGLFGKWIEIFAYLLNSTAAVAA
jgi:hypothetical protein